VAARFVGACLDRGDDLEKALRRVCETFDGFYTLLAATPTQLAVVRDAIACKPALIAEGPGWVAVASEYRALSGLPGIGEARVFEPAPEEVYLWSA
jgi:glutamate synthase domain-containing protein 1